MDISEDVGDVEFHSEETCLGVVDEVIGGSPAGGAERRMCGVDNYPGVFNTLTGFRQLTSVKTQQCPK